jgi:MtrB/PioB family decaheme-associated outer membrane protein
MNRKPICILVASLFAVPAALAQEKADDFRFFGSVGIGGIHTDDGDAPDAAKLNEYRDLSNGLLTTIDAKGRGSRHWFDLFAENLGRDDQYATLRGGMYDTFRYRLYTDALKHNFMFNGLTPYAGAGGTTQTTTFPRLDPSTWFSLGEGYKRRDDGGMFEFKPGGGPWYVRVDANQVTWSGAKPGSSSQGSSPGNGFVELAFPVKYTTRTATVEGGYNTRQMRFDLSWMTSKFENDNESLTWTNGYLGNGTDRTYLAADNRYQKLMANAAFQQLPWSTTVAARFTMDELKSNIALANSFLSGTTGTSTTDTPNASSYNGKVENQTFSVTANSAPTKGLDTRLYYNFRKRDDQSTNVLYPGSGSENSPFSYRKQNLGFDAYYRLDRANRFGVGYDHLDTDREGRHDFDSTKDQRLFLEWKNSSLDDLAVRLKYTRLDRDADFLHANDGANSNDPAYLNRFVTAFDLSNVTQDQWKLTLDYTVMERLDLGFEGIIKTNKYKDNTLGRLKDDRREVYLSASYGFPNGARFTIFGDNEEIKVDSQHRVLGDGAQSGAYDPNTPATASNYNWSGKIKDRNWAAGVAFDWPATEKLSLQASAIYYKTDGFVDLSLQQGVPSSVTSPVAIPTWDDSKRTSLSLKATWTFSKTLSFTGGYAYEKYEYSDTQFDGYQNTISGSSNQNSYLSGVYARPQYNANIFYATVTYRFF